jgi:putative transposase
MHIIAMSSDEDELWRTFSNVDCPYTDYINARLRVTEHLWQDRFSSDAINEAHLFLHYAILRSIQFVSRLRLT